MKDKYSAVWVSHSSIGDYLKCPRAYYIKNVYRDPKSRRKVMLISPALALGQAVHEVVESLSMLPVEERLNESLFDRLEKAWSIISGKRGGFTTSEEEQIYKTRATEMIKRVMDNPGPVKEKAIKIRADLPYFWLSEEDNIILCGKIDWLQYLDKTDSVKIIDFKTGKHDEDPDSLQIPIYTLIAAKSQKKPISGAAYWYLDRDSEPIDVELPDQNKTVDQILEIAKRIALARKLERFVCKFKDGCSHCQPYESIISGKAEFVGTSSYQDIYIQSPRLYHLERSPLSIAGGESSSGSGLPK